MKKQTSIILIGLTLILGARVHAEGFHPGPEPAPLPILEGTCNSQVEKFFRENIGSGVVLNDPPLAPSTPLPKGFRITSEISVVAPRYHEGGYNISNAGAYEVNFRFSDETGKHRGEALICARLNGDCKIHRDQIVGIGIFPLDQVVTSLSTSVACGSYDETF